MSITIEEGTARRLRRYAVRERRAVSTVVEMAIEQLLERQAPAADHLVTSRGSFRGKFSREDTYEGR
jgi:predicted transcriptional regulator